MTTVLYWVGVGLAVVVALAVVIALLAVVSVAAAALAAALTAVATVLYAGWYVASALVTVLRSDEVDHLGVFPPDPGGRSYWFGPAWHDYALAVEAGGLQAHARTIGRDPGSVRAHVFGVWDWTDELDGDWAATAGMVVAAAAITGGLAGLGVGTVVAIGFLVVTSLVFGLLLAVVVLAMWAVAGVLRGLELVRLRVRGITVECPDCHRGVGIPAYECPGCQREHRRLVPGPLGLLSRTCGCGTELPTLLGRGRSTLIAHCGRDGCHGVLPVAGLTAPTRHVPIVAGTVAGKTVHLMSVMAQLRSRPGFGFADDHTRTTFDTVDDALRDVHAVPATLPTSPLRAATFYLGEKAGRRLVYVYDAAGERYQTSDRVSGLRFLGSTAGVLFVLDPFALQPVRERLAAEQVALPAHSEDVPSDVLTRFTAGLKEHDGGRTSGRRRSPIAVVLTKCDVLRRDGPASHPYADLDDGCDRDGRDAAVRRWLTDVAGEGGLLRQIDRTYMRSSFFAVSALDAFGSVDPAESPGWVSNDAPSDPVRWLLDTKEAAW